MCVGGRMVRSSVFLVALLVVASQAHAQSGSRQPFPYQSGTYTTEPRMCRMTADQWVDRYKDAVGAMVINLDGRNIDNGYELSCTIVGFRLSGSQLTISARCDAEGDRERRQLRWTVIDDSSFRVGSRTYGACGKLIR